MKILHWVIGTFGEQNLYAALLGWLIFTVVALSIYKDENEKTWNFLSYASEHWDNWLANLAIAFGLLWVGKNKLDIPMVDGNSLQWKDIYYLGSGFAYELLVRLIKLVRASK